MCIRNKLCFIIHFRSKLIDFGIPYPKFSSPKGFRILDKRYRTVLMNTWGVSVFDNPKVAQSETHSMDTDQIHYWGAYTKNLCALP
jgi:hypothetical protein